MSTLSGRVQEEAKIVGHIYAPNSISAYDVAVKNGFEGTQEEWLASLKGQNGHCGKSAYRIAVEKGFEGTQEEWLESLKGSTGQSAWEAVQDSGFTGTYDEWVDLITGKSIVAIVTAKHNDLDDRDSDDAHPIKAISGLDTTINSIEAEIEEIDKKDIAIPMTALDILDICN